MGEELWLLDPYPHPRNNAVSPSPPPSSDEAAIANKEIKEDEGGESEGASSSSSTPAISDGASGVDEQAPEEPPSQASDKDKSPNDPAYGGSNLKSLVIELDHGVVGVASAGPDFYVVALADSSVEHGALAGRLRSLGSHVREALSLLE